MVLMLAASSPSSSRRRIRNPVLQIAGTDARDPCTNGLNRSEQPPDCVVDEDQHPQHPRERKENGERGDLGVAQAPRHQQHCDMVACRPHHDPLRIPPELDRRAVEQDTGDRAPERESRRLARRGPALFTQPMNAAKVSVLAKRAQARTWSGLLRPVASR
jgi:hypothetical protein